MSLGNTLGKKNDDLFMKINRQKMPKHVAIIMDGNGRWAKKQGKKRYAGHNRGAKTVSKIVEQAAKEKAEQERQRSEKEHQRAEKLAAK